MGMLCCFYNYHILSKWLETVGSGRAGAGDASDGFLMQYYIQMDRYQEISGNMGEAFLAAAKNGNRNDAFHQWDRTISQTGQTAEIFGKNIADLE